MDNTGDTSTPPHPSGTSKLVLPERPGGSPVPAPPWHKKDAGWRIFSPQKIKMPPMKINIALR